MQNICLTIPYHVLKKGHLPPVVVAAPLLGGSVNRIMLLPLHSRTGLLTRSPRIRGQISVYGIAFLLHPWPSIAANAALSGYTRNKKRALPSSPHGTPSLKIANGKPTTMQRRLLSPSSRLLRLSAKTQLPYFGCLYAYIRRTLSLAYQLAFLRKTARHTLTAHRPHLASHPSVHRPLIWHTRRNFTPYAAPFRHCGCRRGSICKPRRYVTTASFAAIFASFRTQRIDGTSRSYTSGRHRPRRIRFRIAAKSVPIIPTFRSLRSHPYRTLSTALAFVLRLFYTTFAKAAYITALFSLIRVYSNCHGCPMTTALFPKTASVIYRKNYPPCTRHTHVAILRTSRVHFCGTQYTRQHPYRWPSIAPCYRIPVASLRASFATVMQ